MKLIKINKKKYLKIDKAFFKIFNSVKKSSKNINFSSGFYYYNEFPIPDVFKKILQKIVGYDSVYDYVEEDLEKFGKEIIVNYLNNISEYNKKLKTENIFFTSGVFYGLQLLNYVLLDKLGTKRKVLVISPNYMEGVNILTTFEDEIFIYDYTINGSENIDKLMNYKFDFILCENPIWPQSYYLSNDFIEKLSKITTYLIIDKSIDSYNYSNKNIIENNYSKKVIIFHSVSKEYGIPFKGYFVCNDKTLLNTINYYYDSFGFSSNILLFILIYIYIYKNSCLNDDYKKILFKNSSIIEKFGLNEIFLNDNFLELDNYLQFNKDKFLFFKKIFLTLLKKYIISGVIKIYQQDCGMNIMIGIKKNEIPIEKMFKIMTEKYNVTLSPTYFPIGLNTEYKYNLFRFNLSTSDKIGFVIGIKNLSNFLDTII